MKTLAHQEKFSKRDNGFTIVELLIAITLVGVIMGLVFSGIWTARRSWESVTAKIDTTESMRLAQGFLRRNISQARPVVIEQEGGKKALFQGDATSLQFVAPAPVQQQILSRLYLYSVRFVAGHSGKGQILVAYMNYFPDRTDFGADEFKESFVLIDDVAQIEIDYFGKEKADGQARWLPQWDRVDSLPELVRFKITLVDSKDEWPDLVIPIKGLAG